ncbi:winged helix-turn-helix domain-containing protein [Vulcanisaeta thermophila]|uniref:winged helix-turn-helix domain-containing protein n=1 Tax=Vulcanisaeta thermophila TaxID=867917 RepID=UPI00085381AD|nr:winged helix-turn-helix domain-containing protein [Vulcanisaeta thermophila]
MNEDIEELIKILKGKGLNNSIRLGILIALYYVNGYVTFTDLLRSLDIPRSSLHEHLNILRREGLIEIRRAITVMGVRTVIRITEQGKLVVKKYMEIMRRLSNNENHKP